MALKDMALYVTFGPDAAELPELDAVAGLRWTIEERSSPPRARRLSAFAKCARGAAGVRT